MSTGWLAAFVVDWFCFLLDEDVSKLKEPMQLTGAGLVTELAQSPTGGPGDSCSKKKIYMSQGMQVNMARASVSLS